MSWFWGALLALSVSILSYRLKFLTGDGAVAAFLTGWIIFGCGKLAFSLVILIFFFSSSLLSKLGKPQKSNLNAYFQKGDNRDAGQVIANGGVPTILLLIWYFSQESILVALFLSALAAATADTWATEVGVLSASDPRSILNLKKVPKGTSGGVSMLGTLAALAGAALVAVLGAFIFLTFVDFTIGWLNVTIIIASALIAQFVDSFLGATMQVRYQCHGCGGISEKPVHCQGQASQIFTGLRWLTNDAVNFVSAMFSAILAWVLITLTHGQFTG